MLREYAWFHNKKPSLEISKKLKRYSQHFIFPNPQFVLKLNTPVENLRYLIIGFYITLKYQH